LQGPLNGGREPASRAWPDPRVCEAAERGRAADSQRPEQKPPLAEPRTVMVYDLGGGTFDVTLVRLSRKRFQVLAIEGDVRLGGKDWDDRVVNWAAERFKQQFGSDPRDDEQSLAMLQASAERAKRTLSKVEQTTLAVARGAAVHAGIVAQREELIRNGSGPALELLADVVEISVNAHSLGVEVRRAGEKVNDRLIAKNTQLPAAVSRVYYTVTDGQPR